MGTGSPTMFRAAPFGRACRRPELAEVSGRRRRHSTMCHRAAAAATRHTERAAFKAPNRHIWTKNRRTNTKQTLFASCTCALAAMHVHLSNYDITGDAIYVVSEVPAYVDTKKKEMFSSFVIVQSAEFQAYQVGQISQRKFPYYSSFLFLDSMQNWF